MPEEDEGYVSKQIYPIDRLSIVMFFYFYGLWNWGTFHQYGILAICFAVEHTTQLTVSLSDTI